MEEIDSLQININATVTKANDSLDNLVKKLDQLAISLQKVGGSKIAGLDNFQKQSENISKSINSISEKYKDLGKGFELKGSTQYLQKQIDSLSNSLARATLKKNELEASDKTGGQMYEYAVRDIIKYGNQIESLKNQLNSIGETKISPELELKLSNLEQAENKIREVTAELPKVAEISPDGLGYNQQAIEFVENYSKQTEESVASLSDKLNQLTIPDIREENLEKLDSQIEKTEEKLDELRNKLSNALVVGTITESVDDKGYVHLQEQIALAEKRLEAFRKKKSEVENSPSTKLDDFRNKISKVGTTLSKVTSRFSKFAAGIKGVISKIANLGKSVLGLNKHTKGLNSSFSGGLKKVLAYGFGIRSIYTLFNKLRNAIKEGMKNLVQFSSETNASMSLLTNSLMQLKNATAAAASPLLNALAPALNTIIQWCVSAANAVNQLISSLTGKSTWIKATEITDNYADSLDKAGKSAKGALRPFDELNNITSQSGGETETKAEDMFETVPIETNISDTAEKIKNAWENADFSEIGSILGNKLKEVLSKINWSTIQEAAVRVGKSLATLLNGAVEAEGLGYSIGQTLGNAINTGVMGINAFLDNTHWDSVGQFLGEGANGVVDSVNFEDIGHMFAQKWNAIFETLGEFARTFDWINFGSELANGLSQAVSDFNWEENGESLSDFVKGCLDTIIIFLEETDWQDIGNKVADFIGAIDWSGLFARLSEGIGAALGGLAAFIWGIIESAWNDVVTWWYDVAYEDGEFTMKGLLEGIWEKIKDIGTWIKEHIFQPFIEGFKKAFGIHSPSTVMKEQGGFIVSGLLKGLTDNITSVWSWAKEIPDKFVGFFQNLPSNLKTIGGNIISGLWNGMKSMWSSVTSWLSDAASDISKTVSNVLDIHSPSRVMAELGGYTIEGFKEGMENLYKPTLESLKGFSYDVEVAPAPTLTGMYESYQPAYANSYTPSYSDNMGYFDTGNQQSNTETNALLRELLTAVRQGKVIEMDGREVARQIQKEDTSYYRRTGNGMFQH